MISHRAPVLASSTLLLLASLPAAAQDRLWIHQFGTTNVEQPAGVVSDGAGGAYLCGFTAGNLAGPNVGVFDIWLARFDASGSPLWTRQFGTGELDSPHTLIPDGAGGVYLAGETGGSLFQPYAGDRDTWIARYDGSGARLWGVQLGTIAVDETVALVPDGAGGLLVSGQTGGDLGGQNAGNWDTWLARYTDTGTQLWIRQLGSVSGDLCEATIPDGEGGVFLAGWTGGSFGGPSAGGQDAWLARYDGAGTQLWIRQLGTDAGDVGRCLSADAAGGVFICGGTTGSLGGPFAGERDTWLAHYDNAGNQEWIRQIGTSSFDDPIALVASSADTVVLAGRTGGGLDGPNAGMRDVWLAQYNGAGERRWIRQLGSAGSDTITDVVPDGAGGVVAGGYTEGSLGGPSAGFGDPWLARYHADGGRTWIRQFGSTSTDTIKHLAADSARGIFTCGETLGGLDGPSSGGYDTWIARYDIGRTCTADWDDDETVSLNDISAFITVWLDSVQNGDFIADFNSDLAVNSNDLSAFLTAWLNAIQDGC